MCREVEIVYSLHYDKLLTSILRFTAIVLIHGVIHNTIVSSMIWLCVVRKMVCVCVCVCVCVSIEKKSRHGLALHSHIATFQTRLLN